MWENISNIVKMFNICWHQAYYIKDYWGTRQINFFVLSSIIHYFWPWEGKFRNLCSHSEEPSTGQNGGRKFKIATNTTPKIKKWVLVIPCWTKYKKKHWHCKRFSVLLTLWTATCTGIPSLTYKWRALLTEPLTHCHTIYQGCCKKDTNIL